MRGREGKVPKKSDVLHRELSGIQMLKKKKTLKTDGGKKAGT